MAEIHVERCLGRLEAKQDAMMEFEEREHSKIDARFDTLEKKVDSLRLDRSKLIGFGAGSGAFFGSLAGYFARVLHL